MTDNTAMTVAARDAMIHVLGLEPDHTVLIVTDRKTTTIGEAFQQASAEHGCETSLFLLPQDSRPLAEIPDGMVEQLASVDIVINCFEAIAEETPFRIKWIMAVAETKRVILGHCPGITESMMTDGPMNVDYAEMQDRADRLIEAFANAVSAHITTPAGTDLVLDLTGRPFVSDVHATVEHGSNLPCGEIFCGPVETGADGVLVVDGSIGGIDQPAKPVTITVAGGRINSVVCEEPEAVAGVEKLTSVDAEARVIGELGIGVNPGAKVIGNMLEDEKAFRTAHIAFGNNSEFPGGQNNSQTHHDFLFHEPTFAVTFADGAKKVLIKDGDIVV